MDIKHTPLVYVHTITYPCQSVTIFQPILVTRLTTNPHVVFHRVPLYNSMQLTQCCFLVVWNEKRYQDRRLSFGIAKQWTLNSAFHHPYHPYHTVTNLWFTTSVIDAEIKHWLMHSRTRLSFGWHLFHDLPLNLLCKTGDAHLRVISG